jgi:hypothetical protein
MLSCAFTAVTVVSFQRLDMSDHVPLARQLRRVWRRTAKEPAMTFKHLVLPIAFLSLTGGAFAATVSKAGITIQSLTISADQAFILSSANGTVSADAGPDSLGNSSNQGFVISGPASADALIATATAHADSSIPTFGTNLVTSITLAGRINATSSVNLAGAASSQSLGMAGPIFDFRAPGASATNPVHLTFSMTMYGSIGGAADPPGSYLSEVKAQFGYLSNGSLTPVDFFDLVLAGPPPNSPLLILDPVMISGIATFDSSGDFLFQALAEARSNATSAPEPLTLSLFGAGLLGAAALRRRKRQL